VDEAVAQAGRFRTTWHTELVRCTIHGILHLLGFDDLNPVARRKMKRAENRWLRELARRFTLTRLARRRATP
jgi:rRNA maturation RNase YbeY